MDALSHFRLRVQGGPGQTRDLVIDSATAADAVHRANQLGLVVVGVEPLAAPRRSLPWRAGDFSLLLFSQELLALLEAGLHLHEALTTLLAKEEQPAARQLLQHLCSELAKGRGFSDVLAGHPRRFPPVYVAIVRSAERTGDLPRALARFITYQQQFDNIRKKLVAASIYPALLLLVGAAVTLFLLAYVVPRFSQVYASAGREMPAASAWLLQIGSFIQQQGWLLTAGAASALVLAAAWLGARGGWAALGQVLLRLPGIAPRAREFRLARFYRAVGLLLGAGIALPRALGMVTGLLDPAQRQGLAQVRSMIDQGLPLSSSLVAQGLASPVARSLLTVGERSGQLGEMLERSARFHDEALERWLDWASRLLEPLLMTLIGLVIGGVVVLMYLPIFELAGGL